MFVVIPRKNNDDGLMRWVTILLFSLFLGLLPLLAFVIVDTFLSMKAALITTVVMAVVEAIWTYFTFNELDSVTIFTLVSVLIMALISYKNKRLFS